jgi:hypothetical protein
VTLEGIPGAPRLGAATRGRVKIRAANAATSSTRGFSAVYHGFAWMPESAEHGLTDVGRDRELAYVRHARLAVARTWFGSDWTMPEWGGHLQWDTVRFKGFIRWLEATAAAGCDVALNGGWWFPESVRSSTPPGEIPPTSDDLEIFVRWLTESVRYLRVELGFSHVRYIHLFTEPREFGGYGTLPDGEDVRSYYAKVVRAVSDRLKGIDELRDQVKLVAPNSVPLGTSRVALQDAVADLSDVVDVFSCHDYGNFEESTIGSRRYDAWYEAVSLGVSDVRRAGCEAPFWLDEHGWLTRSPADEAYRDTADYGTYAVESALGALNAGAETSMLWLFADQHYAWPLHEATGVDSFESGCHRYGLMPWHADRALVRPGWFSFALASRALGGGGLVHDVHVDQHGIHAAVVSHPSDDTSAVFVNATDGPANIAVHLEPLNGRSSVNRYLVDPELLPNDPFSFTDMGDLRLPLAHGTFDDVIPAGAVMVVTSRDLSPTP